MLGFAAPLAAAPKWSWPKIPAAELACVQCPFEPDAPAEILDQKIVWDQGKSDVWDEYVRIKIYDPTVTEELTRRSMPETLSSNTNILAARHTRPDGRQIEFGESDCKIRESSRQSASVFKERFLAIPEIEKYSIVEFHTRRNSYQSGGNWGEISHLQENGAAVRNLEIRWVVPPMEKYKSSVFVVNAPTAKVERLPKGDLRLVATNLPSLSHEPFDGPITDTGATAIWCCSSTAVPEFSPYLRQNRFIQTTKNNDGWAPLATIAHFMCESLGEPSNELRRFANELCANVSDEREKARRIHRHVQNLHLERRNQKQRIDRPFDRLFLTSLDDLLDSKKSAEVLVRDMDYFWLAFSLYKAAGLKTGVILLPDRDVIRFDRSQIAWSFLPQMAITLQIGDERVFSCPIGFANHPLGFLVGRYSLVGFGMLPPHTTGQVGLLGLRDQEVFVPVPPLPAAASRTATIGVFKLDAEGNLEGQARRKLTGNEAIVFRNLAYRRSEREQFELVRQALRPIVAGVDLEITKLTGVDDPDEPIDVEFKVTWPGFATVAGDRMIFRPAVFQRELSAPFSAEKRRNPVHFPFPHEQSDSVGIQLPAGFKPEALPEPGVLSGGKALAYGVKFAFEEKRRLLTVRRDFSSSILDVPAEAYPMLKEWFDARAVLDQQEVVFVRTAAPAP